MDLGVLRRLASHPRRMEGSGRCIPRREEPLQPFAQRRIVLHEQNRFSARTEIERFLHDLGIGGLWNARQERDFQNRVFIQRDGQKTKAPGHQPDKVCGGKKYLLRKPSEPREFRKEQLREQIVQTGNAWNASAPLGIT